MATARMRNCHELFHELSLELSQGFPKELGQGGTLPLTGTSPGQTAGRCHNLDTATYDTLPCPQHSTQWYGEEVVCPLCWSIKVSLYATAKHAPAVKPDSMHQPPAQKRDQYAHTWQRVADVGIPQKTAGVSKRDCENDSSVRHLHVVHCGEECPNHFLKQKMTTAHERKHLKYIKLAAKCQEAAWNLACEGWLYIAGFVCKTTVQLLHGVGVVGLSLRKATKVMGDETEKERCTGGCTGLVNKHPGAVV